MAVRKMAIVSSLASPSRISKAEGSSSVLVSFASADNSGPLSSSPMTPSTARPALEEQAGFLGRQAHRAIEVIGKMNPDVLVLDGDLDHRVGRVRRNAHELHDVGEVAHQIVLRICEFVDDLVERRAGVTRHPRNDRQ